MFKGAVIDRPLVSQAFLCQDNVVDIARSLIGKTLITFSGNSIRAGLIAETEAYAGSSDKASHAYLGKRTERTSTLFMPAGHCYVYLCYGIHSLFNIVTNSAKIPHAVLIRGVIPLEKKFVKKEFQPFYTQLSGAFNGPGKLSNALNIGLNHNRILLNSTEIWLYEGVEEKLPQIIAAQRVGVAYAGEDAKLLYRFYRSDYRPVKPPM